MYIKTLKLMNFRNYSGLRLSLSPGLNVFVGDNAQGKTNILEAVFVSTYARSHRTTKDDQLIMNGANESYIGLTAQTNEGEVTVEVKRQRSLPSRFSVDSKPVKRLGDLMGSINACLFSPESLSIVKGSPEDRRRFLDMALSQLHPQYFYRLVQYNTALKQRNALLKSDVRDPAQLLMWDALLASHGAQLMAAREAFVRDLAQRASRLHLSITQGKEVLRVSYAPSVEPSDDMERSLLDALSRCVEDDLRRGFTTRGPHRDDIALWLNDSDVRFFGSQGQQRTAALALKLSEVPLVRETRGDTPVLLLDDVFSELDDARRDELVKAMSQCQCLLTCTSVEGLKCMGLPRTKVFACRGGAVEEMTI
ncbi:MAG: DNA replication/repair protein RecF [Clostridia bacterium]|nr:DNA replication/repair protein RecF [Clostridia bacterium]